MSNAYNSCSLNLLNMATSMYMYTCSSIFNLPVTALTLDSIHVVGCCVHAANIVLLKVVLMCQFSFIVTFTFKNTNIICIQYVHRATNNVNL